MSFMIRAAIFATCSARFPPTSLVSSVVLGCTKDTFAFVMLYGAAQSNLYESETYKRQLS
jgi:hypothetical protein